MQKETVIIGLLAAYVVVLTFLLFHTRKKLLDASAETERLTAENILLNKEVVDMKASAAIFSAILKQASREEPKINTFITSDKWN